MDKGRFLGLRLFLEGIEVDVASATVSAGINTASTAVIDIPATDAAHKLEPRTLVHLFYLESGYNLVKAEDSEESRASESGVNEPRVDPTAKRLKGVRLLDTADLSNWRLLFAGEVVGYGYSRVGAFRQIQLQCQDFTGYWDQCKLYWGKAKLSSNSYKKTMFAGATHIHSGRKQAESAGDLLRILMSRPSTIPRLPGILGGVVNLLESAVGVYDSSARKRYRGVNDFMTQAELRLKLTRTIAASPDDDTSAQFLNEKSFRRYLRQITRRVKSTASYLDLAQVFLGKCYHQWASLTAPPFISAGEQNATVTYLVSTGVKFRDPKLGQLYKEVDKAYQTVNKRVVGMLGTAEQLQEKLQDEHSDPHKHGVDGDKRVVDTDSVSKFSKSVTDTQLWGKDFTVGSDLREGLEPGDEAHVAMTHLKDAQDLVAEKITPDTELSSEETAAGIKTDARDVERLNSLLEKAKESLTKKGRGTARRVKKKIPLNSRLHMSLFTPDIYMVPPPTCNVLFPDHYSSLSFSRAWMSEITRLWLHGRTATGRDKKNMYFSPNTDILTSEKYKFDATQAVKRGVSFIMGHERFTGIVPAIEGLGDNDVFERLHKKTVKTGRRNLQERKQDAKEGRDMAGQAIFSPQEHLQRAANYLFFAKRYARRVINVSARFSPQIIVGVPCLILDPMKGQRSRFKPSKGSPPQPDADSTTERDYPMGTHYVGVVANIRHQINAAGGAATTIQLVKCRAHNEGVDLFKEPDDEGYASIEKGKKRRVTRRTRGAVVINDINADGSVDINGKGIDDVVVENGNRFTKYKRRAGASYTVSITEFEGTDDRRSTIRNERGELVQPPDKHGLTLGADGEGDRVGEGVDVTSRESVSVDPVTGELSINEASRSLAPDHAVVVDVKETRVIDNRTPVKFSFEGTTTPPWFSPIYMPAAIGRDFYKKMFGCPSVLDSGLLADYGSVGDDVVATPGQMHTISFETKDGSGITEVAIPAELVNPAVTVKKAADVLAEFWLGLSEIGADMDLFIDVYTKRKYANILEVLGNTNPDLLVTAHNGVEPVIGDDKYEGFHGGAFGQKTNFEGSSDYEPLGMLNVKATKRLINPKMDTRKEKYQAVLRYKEELSSFGANNVYGFGENTAAPTESGDE